MVEFVGEFGVVGENGAEGEGPAEHESRGVIGECFLR